MGDYFFGEEVMGTFSSGSRLFDGCVPALRGVSLTEDVVLVWRDGSALRAGVLSFASPKESSQRKGDPRVGARCAGSLRYSAVWAAG